MFRAFWFMLKARFSTLKGGYYDQVGVIFNRLGGNT